ncbi:plasmid replication initiator TrfA [Chromatium okenii]|uniref:plasmid replication initiator TrfA n=1 Tax=Chromatium okenii TaxID=61644 RepID=UPI001F5BF8CA|nr:plasmid replication initiator TrfA [Chromatium okenii]
MQDEEKKEKSHVSMMEKVTRMRATTAERTRLKREEEDAKAIAQGKALQTTAKIIQLPVWPDCSRGVPNGVLRSALFGAIKRGPRKFINREFMNTLEGYEIRYTGARLDQSDLDVWETLLDLSKQASENQNHVYTSERALLQKMGRAYGKSGREWLKSATARLSATNVEFNHTNSNYGGSLVDEFYRDDDTGRYVIVLNPKLQAMFARDDWTQINWEQRQRLKGQPLAQWLHGFYSTHAEPYPVKVKTLHRLSGSENMEICSFRQKLRENLKELDAVTGWVSSIDKADNVHVKKTPTPSQTRHLNKKK